MKITKILAGISALAIASMTAIPAFAEKTITDNTGLDYVEVKEADGVYQYYVDLAQSPYDPATVSAVKFSFTVDDSAGFGGGLMLNSNKSGWDQDGTVKGDWGNEGAEKSITAEGSDGNYTLTFDFGALGEEYWGAPTDEQYWAQVVCQLWWGNDVTMTGVEITGDEKSTDTSDSQEESKEESKDESKEESKSEESSSKAEESSKAASNNNNGKSGNTTTTGTTSAASSAAASDNTNQATGATAGLAFAGLALAGAVAVVAKKKN